MSLDRTLCEGCPIDGLYDPLESRGNDRARFLVVTDVPSQAAGREDRLLTPKQMGLLAVKLGQHGFKKDDFRFTPACHCPYDPNEHTNKDKTAIHKHCRQHFMEEASAPYEAIVPLGAVAASQVFGKSTKINKVRGMLGRSEDLDKAVFPLMSIGTVLAYPQNEPVFDADIASFARTVEAGYDVAAAASQQIGDYEIIEDLQFLIDMDPEVISFDTENTGLRWYQSGVDVRSYRAAFHKGQLFNPRFQILTMQFTVEEGKGYMLVWDHPEKPIPEKDKPRLRNQLRKLLCAEHRIVVGQAAKYDNVALWMTEGIRYRVGGDTLMLATLLDENMPERNLDVLTKIHVPEMAGYADVFNATYDKSRMWEVPISQLVGYGCGDTDAAYRIYHKLEEQVMADEKLWAHYCHVTLPGLNAFSALETRGMHIDEADALASFKETMIREVGEQYDELIRQIPRPCKQDIVAKFLEKPANRKKTAAEALAFSRNDFVKEVLFTHPKGFRLTPRLFTKSTAKLNNEALREPSTSAKDHLPYFFEECPFTEELAEYQKDRHLLGTNVIKFEENYIRGGKVRPTYHLHKTVTGRSSSDDPNGQNYPKRSKKAAAYRRMFVAPPGYYVVEADLSQAELRIAACMSGDKTMIEIYRTGGDIHKMTGAIVAGLTPEAFAKLDKKVQKDYRQKAKAVNFGFLYGMGWRKFIGYAKTQYNAVFTEDEAQRVRKAFFAKYRSLPQWHNAMREFAQEHKFVRSFDGRIRHLPMIDSPEEYIQQEAGRQAINSPVQEFGSSLGVMAQGRINEEVDPQYLQLVGFIHDAIVVYVKKEYLDWGMKTLKRYMQTNPLEEWFNVKLKVPIIADVGFGENLGEVHECEGFELDKPYDFAKLDKEGKRVIPIDVPAQKVPPNNGMLTRSPYTTPEDLEPEDIEVIERRRRLIRGVVSKEAQKRVERSKKQMVINKRNADKKKAELEAAKFVKRLTRRAPAAA
jgi:DNA polymerase I-like protein with 3'-5' exonuclease and polymerase domains/uracil-DNA glycosylase